MLKVKMLTFLVFVDFGFLFCVYMYWVTLP